MAEVTLNEQHTTNRKTLSITDKTYARLAKLGHWTESADSLINRILDERDGRERSSGSF